MATFVKIHDSMVNIELVTDAHWDADACCMTLHFALPEACDTRVRAFSGVDGDLLFAWFARNAIAVKNLKRHAPVSTETADEELYDGRRKSVLNYPTSFYTD